MRAWLLLTIAGLLEVVWAIGLKKSDGFTRPLATSITVVAMISSMFLLGVAVKQLPVGTAYAVWVGIGAVGTFIVGAVVLGEPLTWLRIGFVTLLIVSLAGLKMTAT